MEQKLGTFINKNGGTFTMPIVEKEDVSVLEGGYLITKDGQFIPVKDGQDHDKEFNEYLNKYECRETPVHYDTAKAFTILVNDGIIVHMGRKMGDNLNTIEGAYIVLMPYEDLTEEQEEAIDILKKSNVGKVFKGEIVPLTFIHLDSTMYEFKEKEGKSLH